ncbi:MAG: Ig-like domain-containing protein [Xanthobacteraceae bacterium]|nr:Ig-like domain-containing protein [Xanthobacteraceae bacterium]
MLVASGVEFGDVQSAGSGQHPQPIEVIGSIQAAIGCGTITRASGIAVQAVVGDPVCQGDVVETAADGRIEIRLIDGTVFNLSRDTRVVLSEAARDSNGALRSAVLAVTGGMFAFAAGQLARTGSLTVDTPVGSIRSRAQACGIGMLSLAALTFSLLKEAQAADPNVTFLDDGNITYKDFRHGVFELVTKEAVPRHIIVEDPGETVVLSRKGSSVSVNQVMNSPARMEELQAAQQDALANYARGLGPGGSSTPPFLGPQQLLQPINFIQVDPTHSQNSLPPLELPAAFSVPELFPPPPPSPPTLAITSVAGQIAIAGDDIINAAKADAGVEITGATSGVQDGRIVTVTIVDGSNQVVYSGTATVAHGAWQADVSPADAKALADGIYTLTAEVSNATGSSAEASQTIRVDETPPTIAIDRIARSNVVNANTAGAGFAIAGTVSDAENGQPVTVRIVDGSGHVVDTFFATLRNDAWSVNVDSTEARSLKDGTYTVTADVSDTAGNPALEAKQTLTVDETPPTVTWSPQPGSGIEGTPIALGTITATVNSLPGYGDGLQSLVVSGIPVGTVLSDGTNTFTATRGSTSIDVKSWNLADLKITPPNDTNFILTVTATDQAGNTASTGELVTVAPLAPCLNPVAAQGNENTAIALDLGVKVNSLSGADGDTSPNSLSTLVVSGIPVGATLCDGTGLPGHNFTATAGNTSYDVAGWNLSSLQITPPAEFEGSFTLTIAATERDSEGGISTTVTATDVVTVSPVAEPPTASAPATLTLDEHDRCAAVHGVRVGPPAEDGDDTVTATLTVSHGTLHVASLSGVTVTGGDSATLTLSGSAVAVNELLAGLIYRPTAGYEGCDTLNLSVTSSDGSNTYPTAATASTAISITDFDDHPRDSDAVSNGAAAEIAAASAAPAANTSGTIANPAPASSQNVGFTTATGARTHAPDTTGAANAIDTGGTPTGVMHGGSQNDTTNANNGTDIVIGVFVAGLFAGGTAAFANSAANAGNPDFDTITDFVSGSDRIDLTAFGSLASDLLALTSSSTSVPAHTIAYDSNANQTTVYVNPTDHPVGLGDTGLLEIHLPAATVHLSDFVLPPTKTATTEVAASDPVDPAGATQGDATIVATATTIDSSDATSACTGDASSDPVVRNSAHLADGSLAGQTANIGDSDHAKPASIGDGGTPATESSAESAATDRPGGPPDELPNATGTTPVQTSFAPDQKPAFDSAPQISTGPGVGSASDVLQTPEASSDYVPTTSNAREQVTPAHGASVTDVASGGRVGLLEDSFLFRDEMSGFGDSGIIAAEFNDGPAWMSLHEYAAGTHGAAAILEGAETPGALGDSFQFKNDSFSSKGSGFVEAAGLDQIPAPTSHHDDTAGAHVPPPIPDGTHATELLLPEQHSNDHFNMVPHHPPGAIGTHVPYDLIV